MKRSVFLVIALGIIAAMIGPSAFGQIEGIPGYVATDLQLISQESRPYWSEAWTGPIEAATILAWFHGYGYPRFLTDLNGDGVIDELDTIELADILGKGPMKTQTPLGTDDARLVVGLARYVAERYPDEFVIKIYDASFPAEFSAAGFGQFAPDVIDGIVLEVKEDPSIAAYEHELESAEGVIVGLEENEGENNTYLTGRSFLYDETPEGYTPVDLAWAEEDRWTPGYQGQVLETAAMTDDGMYIDYRGAWTPVEFILALSPIEQRRGGPPTVEGCPPEAVAYDVTVSQLFDPVTDRRIGSVRVEECVTRDGDIDTYTYTLTNIDFTTLDGCGLCFFLIHVPPTLPTVSHSEPLPWLFTGFPGLWAWRTPLGDCGLLPGESATFSASVPGPTADTYVSGGVGACVSPPDGDGLVLVPLLAIRTTGPSEEGEDGGPDEEPGCPDLTVIRVESVCSLDRERTVTVAATIKNIGDQPTPVTTWARLSSSTHPGSDYAAVGTLDPGEETVIHLSFSFSFNYPPCVDFTVEADTFNAIDECNESNNEMDGSICCPK